MIFALVAVIGTVVRQLIREEEAGSSGSGWLPKRVRDVAGIDAPKSYVSPEEAETTDPELPEFDEAWSRPELLERFGVDALVFEENAVTAYRMKGPASKRRRELAGAYARVYVLDDSGDYRTLASRNWLGAREVAVQLEDEARDLAGRLGVPFRVL
jgi:hypothetical protein